MKKTITKVIESVWQAEGRGARVRRSIGRQELRNLDPFLLLDEFSGNAKDGAGFPDHPHRGFETVSYLLEGEFTHEDFMGHKGILKSGDLQWMTAGKGIIHSEMPGHVDTRGLQLWINLKKEYKMVEPAYQELMSSDIPIATQNGVRVKVIAGKSMDIKSPVRTRTPCYYLDIEMNSNSKFTQNIPPTWTTFIYTLKGNVKIESRRIKAHHTIVFSKEGDCIAFQNSSDSMARFILIAGEPINEPIVQHGPFVMNTREEISQAIEDYQMGKNGFEMAHRWKSVEGNK